MLFNAMLLMSKPFKNPFTLPFLFILAFAFVEFFGGIWTQSLALLGDAWHMFFDALALGLALLAANHVSKAKAEQKESKERIPQLYSPTYSTRTSESLKCTRNSDPSKWTSWWAVPQLTRNSPTR